MGGQRRMFELSYECTWVQPSVRTYFTEIKGEMMNLSKIFKCLFAVVTAAAVSIVYQAGISAAEKAQFNDYILYDDLSITGQFVELYGDRPTKFNEYRDVVTGPQGQNEILMVGSTGSPIYGYVEGFDVLRRDQSVLVEFGKLGSYKAAFEFNQIPHNFSRSARTIEQDITTGTYVVDNGIQNELQGMSAANQADRISLLTPEFTERDLDVKRTRYNWNLNAWLSDALHMDLKAGLEDREGLRKKGTGTYMRTGDTFEIRGIELPEPVKYQTLDFGARLTYAAPKSVTSLDWALSYFRNSVDALLWDNPFRITPGAATGSAGGSNRGNFVVGRTGLYPDNIANTITLSQSWTLPYKTTLTDFLSYGIYLQDESFLPYTSNSAINPIARITVDDTSNLPQSSLNGLANVISSGFTVTNRAIDHLKAKAYANVYDYIDNTESITFPGYAAFGDSFWLPEITSESITTHPPSYVDLKTGIDLDYELTKQISLNSTSQYKYRNLKNRQVSDINEYIFKNGIEVRPCAPVKMEGFYTFSWRRFAGDYIFHREAPDARMFDMADRNRNQLNARVELAPSQKLTLGANGMWRRDDHKAAYGLRRNESTNLSLDTEYAPNDKCSIYTYYSYDRGAFNIASIAKSGAPNPTWPISNTWFSDTTENTNTVGTGVRYSFIPDRLSVDLDYSFSLGLQKIVNSNLVPNPVSPLVATAYEWPAVHSDWQEFKVQMNYKIHRNLEFKAYYNLEVYNLNDFAWNEMAPYMQGATADNSTQYLWLDARYDDYVAHVFGVVLRYIF